MKLRTMTQYAISLKPAFGPVLELGKKETKMTKQQVADELGVNVDTLTKLTYNINKGDPAAKTIRRIAEGFNLSEADAREILKKPHPKQSTKEYTQQLRKNQGIEAGEIIAYFDFDPTKFYEWEKKGLPFLVAFYTGIKEYRADKPEKTIEGLRQMKGWKLPQMAEALGVTVDETLDMERLNRVPIQYLDRVVNEFPGIQRFPIGAANKYQPLLILKKLRESQYLEGTVIAQSIGVHKNTYYDYESGKRRIVYRDFSAIASFYETTPEKLLAREYRLREKNI